MGTEDGPLKKRAYGIDDTENIVYKGAGYVPRAGSWTKPWISSGDVVRVACDLREGKKHLTFFQNGTKMTADGKDYTIKLPDEASHQWYPAVSLINPSAWAKIKFL